jgi:hypothetical protein
VLCIEASRLARNGRDWHHLIELCGLVRAIVIDPDGVYDPAILNDRLLLGLKGTMSEFELNLLRQRSLEASHQIGQVMTETYSGCSEEIGSQFNVAATREFAPTHRSRL